MLKILSCSFEVTGRFASQENKRESEREKKREQNRNVKENDIDDRESER